MAVGDVVCNMDTIVNAGEVLDIRPPVGQEWVIHNIYYNKGVEFYRVDDQGNSMLFDSDLSMGARLDAVFHVTNSSWVQMRSLYVATLVGYDGIQSK